MLISENFLISGPQIINEVILQVMGLVLLYIVPNFSLVRCLQTYFLARNIKNIRHEDDTSLMAEIKEELKGILMMVKERVKKLV